MGSKKYYLQLRCKLKHCENQYTQCVLHTIVCNEKNKLSFGKKQNYYWHVSEGPS